MATPRSVSGTLSAAGPGSTYLESDGEYNLSLWGTFVATIVVERSFSGGPWLPLTYVDGSNLQWSGPVSTTLPEPETGVRIRVSAKTYGSGTVNWRLSR